MPVIVVGPVAVRFTELTATVPPLSLVIVFTKVSDGNLLLVNVQTNALPAAVAVELSAIVAVVAVASGVKVTLPAAVPEHMPELAT